MSLVESTGPIRILIVDDDPFFCRMVRAHVSGRAEFEVVGLAADGREAIRLTEELEPDLVLLDVSMPVLDGVATAQIIRAGSSPPAIVLVTGADDADDARAYEAGAAAYLRKTEGVVALMDVILTLSHLRLPTR